MKFNTTLTLAALALTTPILCQAQDPVGSLTQVKQLAAAGKIDEAAQLADRVITKFSGEGYLAKAYSYVVPFYLWEKATMYMKVGRYDEAVEAFKKLNPGQRWSSKEFLNTARASLPPEQMDYVLMYSTASIFQQGHARYKQAIGTDGKGGDLSKLDEAIKYLDEYLKLLEKGKVSKAEKKLKVESQVCFLLMQSCLLKPTPDFKKANEYLEKSMQGKGKLPDDMAIQGLESIVKLATSKPEYIDCAYKIIEWFQKAAEQGNPSAQLGLAVRYYRGEGVEQDYTEAVKWFMKSADQGNATAQNWLAGCYLTGKGVEKDLTKAVEWYRKAAEQDNPSAQLGLAVRYYRGEGVEQDYTEAVKWFKKSAEQGNATAQAWLAGFYYSGEGVKRDFSKAVEWYRKAAEQGNPSAQLELAAHYYRGEGVEQDYTEAVKWFMKSAEQGNATAQDLLAGCYLTGKGVEKDLTKAVEWFKKAAEQGNPNAQLGLAVRYYWGEGVEQDYKEAAKWFKKAAEQGHEEAACYADYIPCNILEEQGFEEQALKRGALLVQQSDSRTTWNLLFSQAGRIHSRLVVNIKTYQEGRELSKDTIRNTLAGFDRLKDASLVLKSKAEARLISSSPEVSQGTIEDIKRLEKLKLSIRENRMNYLSYYVSLPHLREAHRLLGEAKADRWFGYDSTKVNEAVSHMAIVCCESWVLESNDKTREWYYAVLRKLKETVGEADFKDYEQKIKINGGGDAKRGGERWWP